jgi:hypothetical protein
LRHQLAEDLRVVRQPGRAGELLRVEARVAAQEFTQHVAELVLRVLRCLVGHEELQIRSRGRAGTQLSFLR